MLNHRSRQKGFTMVEVMLTMVIASAAIIMVMKMYETYKRQYDALAVVANVDAIAQAASLYYYANCYGTTSPTTGKVSAGTLAPTFTSGSYQVTVPIDITTELLNKGYLNTKLSTIPLVSSYSLQFVQTITPVNICTSSNCASSSQVGTNVSWSIEVGVVPKDPNMMSTYKQMMQADCTSMAKSSGFATCQDSGSYSSTCQGYYATMQANYPNYNSAFNTAQTLASSIGCPPYNISWGASTPSSDTYLVFERMPSSTGSQISPESSQMNQNLNQFKRQYQTYPTTHLTNTSHTTEYQYFTCGS